ncbi:hypothetical protein ABZ622_08680 [Streptomyces sp. NPDC007164]|uniref:hypothetical protein n=1 Tax=Streptomyces sp. NPDC007164 TaxID=3156918 RepID=UPI0033EBF3D1
MVTHDLRHFYASALIAGGAGVKQVQLVLRHASAAITPRIPAHLPSVAGRRRPPPLRHGRRSRRPAERGRAGRRCDPRIRRSNSPAIDQAFLVS